jgi:lipid-A-disaccharide synthase
VEALKRQARLKSINLEIVGLGGERMEGAGAVLLGKTTRIGSMGLIESIPYIVPTLTIQRRAQQYLKENPPDLLVLIDYFGPNVSIGSFVRQNLPQLPIIYYIAPQAWVWSLSDKSTQQLIDITDRLLAIFPAEAQFFRERGVPVSWVGHPLLDRMQQAPTRQQAREKLGIGEGQTAIALLPASRQQELKYILPVICQAGQKIQEKIPDVHFWIPVSLEAYRSAIEAQIAGCALQATILTGSPLEAIAAADLAITKSGTVNLEIALLDVPQVVIYRVNPLTMWVARKVLNFSIPFMSPVNLVAGEEIVRELLQEQATPARILQESLDLLLNPQSRHQTLHDYQRMRQKLGDVGVCDRAAQEILEFKMK